MVRGGAHATFDIEVSACWPLNGQFCDTVIPLILAFLLPELLLDLATVLHKIREIKDTRKIRLLHYSQETID